MTSSTVDRVGNLHATATGQFTGRWLREADDTLFDLDPEPLVATAKPLDVKDGRTLVADLGRGLEELVVMSRTDTIGTRFLQDADGQQWEVTFKSGGCQVVADPDQLRTRARILAEGHRHGVVMRTDYVRPDLDSAGLTERRSLHLATCSQLNAPAATGYAPTFLDRLYNRPADYLVTMAAEQYRTDPEQLCDCLRCA